MRINERSLVVLIGGGLALAIAGALSLFLLLGGDDDDGAVTGTGSPNAASSLAEGPDEVLYLSGTALVRRDLEAGTDEQIGKIPTPSVYASPGSDWIAYVTAKVVEEGDFAAEPVLHLYDAASGDKEVYGAGVAPVWRPSGTHVAFLRPVEPRECQGETCSGASQIGVIDPETGTESLLLEPGNYSILGWAGDWVLVSEFADPTKIISVSLDDEPREVDIPASQFWGASPDGRWVVKTNARKTEFISFEDGGLGDQRVTADLRDYELLEGAWAHDSSRVAAVVRLETVVRDDAELVGKDEGTRIVTFSPDDPEPETVGGTFDATGGVYWSVDNEEIVFTNLVDPKRALYQAMQCPVGNQEPCRIVISWTEGVALLRTE